MAAAFQLTDNKEGCALRSGSLIWRGAAAGALLWAVSRWAQPIYQLTMYPVRAHCARRSSRALPHPTQEEMQ